METKKIFIIVSLISLVIILSFIPVDNIRQTVIKASLYDVAKQISDLNNWKKWNPDLVNKSIKIDGSFNNDQSAIITLTYSYLLHHINPVAVSLRRTLDGSSTSSLIEIASVTDTTTAVSWSEKITFFELMKRSIVEHFSRQTNLDNLKKLIEDVNYKYGFFIKIVPVRDTMILTAKTNIIGNSFAYTTVYLYNLLQKFIDKHGIPYQKKYFYTTALSNHEVAVGVPIYKRIKDSANIKCLQLPGSGRLVEGTYSGRLSDKQSIYTAINNFMMDQHLKQVAQPLEQYSVSDTMFNANSNVNIKIFYPVF